MNTVHLYALQPQSLIEWNRYSIELTNFQRNRTFMRMLKCFQLKMVVIVMKVWMSYKLSLSCCLPSGWKYVDSTFLWYFSVISWSIQWQNSYSIYKARKCVSQSGVVVGWLFCPLTHIQRYIELYGITRDNFCIF